MKLMWPRAFVWYSIYHKWCNIFLHIVLYMNLGLLWIYIHYIFESKSGTNLRDFLAYSWLLWRTTGPQFNKTHLMMKKRKNSITNFLYERRDVRFCMFCLDNCNIIVVLIGFYWNICLYFFTIDIHSSQRVCFSEWSYLYRLPLSLTLQVNNCLYRQLHLSNDCTTGESLKNKQLNMNCLFTLLIVLEGSFIGSL